MNQNQKRSDQGFPTVATFSTSAISALPINGHQTSPAPPLLTADQPVRMYQAFPYKNCLNDDGFVSLAASTFSASTMSSLLIFY
jgi:hypothetical protein